MEILYKLTALSVWVIGVVIAKGFWSTFFALIIPFYAWYLAFEHFLMKFNIL